MKEITRIEKVYDFDELSESAKENARRNYLENFHEVFMFSEDCQEILKTDFPHSDLKVEYSLSYCQGDGLNVYGEIAIQDAILFVTENKEECNKVFTRKERRFLSWLVNQHITAINRSNSHYNYYTSKAEDIRYYIELELEGNYYRDIPYETINKFANLFDDYFKKYCKNLEDDGYNWFYEVEDAEIKEVWDANEYLGFTENGTPVYV